MVSDRQGPPIQHGDDVAGDEAASLARDPGTFSETDAGAMASPDLPTGRFASDIASSMTEAVVRVPVYEEELTATKTIRDVGGLRIEKIEVVEVVEEPRLDTSVTEERLKVVRRTITRSGDAANSHVFEEVIIDVPLILEAGAGGNGGRVTEEIAIWKEAVQRIEHVTATVRREDVSITEARAGALIDD